MLRLPAIFVLHALALARVRCQPAYQPNFLGPGGYFGLYKTSGIQAPSFEPNLNYVGNGVKYSFGERDQAGSGFRTKSQYRQPEPQQFDREVYGNNLGLSQFTPNNVPSFDYTENSVWNPADVWNEYSVQPNGVPLYQEKKKVKGPEKKVNTVSGKPVGGSEKNKKVGGGTGSKGMRVTTPRNSLTNVDRRPPSSKSRDPSILDELDKNDWYLGKDVNFPEVDVNSNLNIDVSELWNFDKRRGLGRGANRSGSRRKGRDTDERRNPPCECVDISSCSNGDASDISARSNQRPWRGSSTQRCAEPTHVCCEESNIRGNMPAPMEMTRVLGCGQRILLENDVPTERRGETTAAQGEFPWVLKLDTLDEDIDCGASLIHAQLALTAAHCVSRVQSRDLIVRGGLWSPVEEDFQVRKVLKVIVHPGYNSDNPRNDIALLVLDEPFQLNDRINTICLPVTNDRWDSDDCTVAGWGLGEKLGSRVLAKSHVRFLPQQECQNIMLQTDLWRKYILHDSFVCGIEETRSRGCLGNEGSPVTCSSKLNPNTHLQIGVVSKGMNCDDFGRPGIFTNVVKFLDWINELAFDLTLFD